MPNVTGEATQAPVKDPAPQGTWIQITFTLDPEHYRTLWERADEANRTIADLVRESVVDYLDEMKSLPRSRRLFPEENKGEHS